MVPRRSNTRIVPPSRGLGFQEPHERRLEAKTALPPYLAVYLLEDYNDRKQAKDVPISADNWESGVASLPRFIYVGAVIIDQSNVQNFLRKNMPKY